MILNSNLKGTNFPRRINERSLTRIKMKFDPRFRTEPGRSPFERLFDQPFFFGIHLQKRSYRFGQLLSLKNTKFYEIIVLRGCKIVNFILEQ